MMDPFAMTRGGVSVVLGSFVLQPKLSDLALGIHAWVMTMSHRSYNLLANATKINWQCLVSVRKQYVTCGFCGSILLTTTYSLLLLSIIFTVGIGFSRLGSSSSAMHVPRRPPKSTSSLQKRALIRDFEWNERGVAGRYMERMRMMWSSWHCKPRHFTKSYFACLDRNWILATSKFRRCDARATPHSNVDKSAPWFAFKNKMREVCQPVTWNEWENDVTSPCNLDMSPRLSLFAYFLNRNWFLATSKLRRCDARASALQSRQGGNISALCFAIFSEIKAAFVCL